MALTDWNIVTRSMRSRWFSTLLTILTVAIAAGLMTLLISMRSAGEDAFKRGTGNVQMLISKEPGPLASVLNSMFYAQSPGNPIFYTQYQELIESYPFAWTVPTQLGDSYKGSPVMGTTGAFFESFEPAAGLAWSLDDGAYFVSPFEVVVGSDAAKINALHIGDSITLEHGTARTMGGHEHTQFSFIVVGILNPTATAHDRALFTSLESAWILHAHDRRESQLGHGIQTTIDDVTDIDRKITGIYASIGHRKAALMQVLSSLRSDPNWTVANPASTVGGLFKIVSNIDQVLLAMAIAVMFSSGISILVALYNSMEQRRRQIAVLRVLGATKLRVFNLVLTESAIIGVLGGFGGIGIALIAGRVVSGILQSRVGIVVNPSLPVDGYLMIVLATVAIAGIAGVIPALIAYRTPVVRSLRPIG
ncbi:MAG: ABC transporter permease [Phycisphaerales bacterium]|nr:ABC transporter permease [Phycisphaerales bacterium]